MTVTEQEWLACTDPTPMLEFLRGKVSERKLRLFACGCVRRAMTVNTVSSWGNAIELAERAADERGDWRAARAALPVPSGDISAADFTPRNTVEAIYDAFDALIREEALEGNAFPWVNSAAADALSATARRFVLLACERATRHAASEEEIARGRNPETLERNHERAERKRQAAYVRDIFVNPFHPVALDRAWLAWRDGTIPKLAQGIYDDRAFDRLPILADALEEAGCTNADILRHCREPGEHVRGCWVLDLLLGKE
jgi:hypothetical protein